MPFVSRKTFVCWPSACSASTTARTKDLYVKLVVSAETTDEEFKKSVALLEEQAPDALFIIQPVTPYGGCEAASPEKILTCQSYALKHLRDVRVIPQTHKMIGQL